MRIARLAVLLVLSAVAVSAVASAKQKTTITGWIVAYRPIDRIPRVSSATLNKELFLFEVEDQKPGKNATVVKIDYGHFGDSEITEQILRDASLLRVKAKRSPVCDQSYSEFLSSVPKRKDEESGLEIENGIAYVGKFKNIEIAPDLMLKCYAVEKGEIQVIGDKSR